MSACVSSSSRLPIPSSQLLTYLNYRGLTIVGYTAIALTVLGLLPFLVLSAMALPLIQPRRWSVTHSVGRSVSHPG